MNYSKLKNIFLSELFRSLMLALTVLLLTLNFYDRRVAVAQINQSVDRFQLSRTMLNSRAKIQIILCSAALEGRRLNAEEVDTIKRLWESAEYNQTTEFPK